MAISFIIVMWKNLNRIATKRQKQRNKNTNLAHFDKIDILQREKETKSQIGDHNA